MKASLQTMDGDAILLIASILDPIPYDYFQKTAHISFSFSPNSDLSSLASTCKKLRAQLAPVLWRTVFMGEAKKDRNYKRKLEELVQKDELLRHVRILKLKGEIDATCFPLVARIVSMNNLRLYKYALCAPMPAVFVNAFSSLTRMESLCLNEYSVESLLALASWNKPLRYIHIDPPTIPALFNNPSQSGVDRKARKAAIADRNKISEKLVKGLARLLVLSASTLEHLTVRADGVPLHPEWLMKLCPKMERIAGRKVTFPQLEYFFVACEAFGESFYDILKISPLFTHL